MLLFMFIPYPWGRFWFSQFWRLRICFKWVEKNHPTRLLVSIFHGSEAVRWRQWCRWLRRTFCRHVLRRFGWKGFFKKDGISFIFWEWRKKRNHLLCFLVMCFLCIAYVQDSVWLACGWLSFWLFLLTASIYIHQVRVFVRTTRKPQQNKPIVIDSLGMNCSWVFSTDQWFRTWTVSKVWTNWLVPVQKPTKALLTSWKSSRWELEIWVPKVKAKLITWL